MVGCPTYCGPTSVPLAAPEELTEFVGSCSSSDSICNIHVRNLLRRHGIENRQDGHGFGGWAVYVAPHDRAAARSILDADAIARGVWDSGVTNAESKSWASRVAHAIADSKGLDAQFVSQFAAKGISVSRQAIARLFLRPPVMVDTPVGDALGVLDKAVPAAASALRAAQRRHAVERDGEVAWMRVIVRPFWGTPHRLCEGADVAVLLRRRDKSLAGMWVGQAYETDGRWMTSPVN